MSFMLKAIFRCMKHLWVHPNAKSGLKGDRRGDRGDMSKHVGNGCDRSLHKT